MDVNNTPYFLLRDADEFSNGSTRLSWNKSHQALVLAQNQTLRLPVPDPDPLTVWENATPLVLDRFNQIARIHADRTYVEYNSGRGFLPLQDGQLDLVAAPTGHLDDLSLGGDGRLAAPFSNETDQHGLLVFHLARRWKAATTLLNARARRVWVDEDNRIWCLGENLIALCGGEPLPLPYTAHPERFEPVTLNPHELKPLWQRALPEGCRGVALCADEDNVYILCHDGAGTQQILKRPRSTAADPIYEYYPLAQEIPFAVDLSLAEPGRLALMSPWQADTQEAEQRDCPVVELIRQADGQSGQARLVRERYPMLGLSVPRFVSSADNQLRYQDKADPDFPDIDPRPRELHALRRPQYHSRAWALLQHVLDSGQPDTVWHRIYMDAAIPHGCNINLAVRVYDTPEQRSEAPLLMQQPPVWNPLPSELPFGRSLAGSSLGEKGLFEILLQRETGPVRRLSGRYLQIEVHFSGDSRHTPALHALRIYAPRFSYQEAYLPQFYRQERLFDPADAEGAANSADTRERFLTALEGMLTPIEARVAAGERLISPEATPDEHLPWLAELLGTRLPPHWPVERQRRLTAATTLVQQWKGTLAGVNLALDIASDGGVRRGEIVALENFRLRRTMATILGVNMEDENHPLTLGTGMSGNSLIGESLILSENDARTFLSLFAPELANKDETAAVNAFFDQYSHQVSILLHGRGVTLRTMAEEVLAEQMPAHLQWQIIETEHPFVLGTAPVLAVDTFLEPTADFRRVTLNDTYLSKEGVLKNPAAFSPRDINANRG